VTSLSASFPSSGAEMDGFQLVELGSPSVPEPSTWTIMLGGLGLLILIVRRKSPLLK